MAELKTPIKLKRSHHMYSKVRLQ